MAQPDGALVLPMFPEEGMDAPAQFIEREDGGIDIEFEDESQPRPWGILGGEWDENLADNMDEQTLGTIAVEVIENVEGDIESRSDWDRKLKEGLKKIGLLGVTDADDATAPVAGASKVIHPLLVEAAVQFQARALEELFPSAGPVKTSVIGRETPEVRKQGDRVQDHMNYQMVHQDTAYFWDVDQMLFYLPFSGSAFKKTWHDPQHGLQSSFLKAGDVIVPYSAKRGREPRMTHRIEMTHNDLLKYQRSRFYRDVPLQPRTDTAQSDKSLSDEADNASPTAAPSMRDNDGTHVLYECHCDFIIAGQDQAGDYEGIAWPYIITVERDSQVVLAIRRNWDEDDEKRLAGRWFTHYRYLPGLGYYGFGLLHAIGGLGEAATGSLRALLDSAAAATFQGGFRTKEGGKTSGAIELEWGKWKDVDSTAEDLAKSFVTPPFREPSAALFQVLGLLVEAGHRFGSTTEAMVGEGVGNTPVGTTVARIEQGSKVYTGIHRRLHKAAGEEFALRAKLNGKHVPEMGYPFNFEGNNQMVYRKDYDDRVDVVPVSDPNIFSSTQRIALAQATLQLAESKPQFYNQLEAHRRMLMALKCPDIDAILIDPTKVEPADPVTEGQRFLNGKPARAFDWEAHDAHIAVHMAQLQQFQGLPVAKQVTPPLIAHLGEHFAHKYRIQMMQAMQMPLPSPDAPQQPLPPQILNAVAMRAAQAVMQIQQAMPQQPDPDAQAAAAEQKRKDEVAAADIRRKDTVAAADQRRKDAQFRADQERAGQESQVAEAEAFLKQAGITNIEPLMLAKASKELGKDFQTTIDLLMRIGAAGQEQRLRPQALGEGAR